MTRRIAVVAVALFLLSACDKDSPNATPTAVTTLGTPTQQATQTASPAQSPTTSTPTAPPTGPRIVYFRVKGSAKCQSYGQAVSYPGSVVLEWEVAGGPTQVTISIDGPGLFGTYAIKHEETFNFTCAEVSNKVTKHTYTLRTVGGPQEKQQTITVEATYH